MNFKYVTDELDKEELIKEIVNEIQGASVRVTDFMSQTKKERLEWITYIRKLNQDLREVIKWTG